jgi:hypothetical protein
VRLGSFVALGVGYVLGTRAGKERYEQLRTLADSAARRLEAYGASGPLATWLEANARPGTARGDLAAGRGRQPR